MFGKKHYGRCFILVILIPTFLVGCRRYSSPPSHFVVNCSVYGRLCTPRCCHRLKSSNGQAVTMIEFQGPNSSSLPFHWLHSPPVHVQDKVRNSPASFLYFKHILKRSNSLLLFKTHSHIIKWQQHSLQVALSSTARSRSTMCLLMLQRTMPFPPRLSLRLLRV